MKGGGISRRIESKPRTYDQQHSGDLVRPVHAIRRSPIDPDNPRTELERYKVALRKHHPVDHGLPWSCQSTCPHCRRIVPSQFVYDEPATAVFLEYDCPSCGQHREWHEDTLFARAMPEAHPRQPKRTRTGGRIRPVLRRLPRTVETLCPECSCIILGRYYEEDNVVYIEKTCPEHGYVRDKVNSDARVYLKATRSVFQDERGVDQPQVRGGQHCPSDCGLCSQHLSTSCLAQIDLSNRCNLSCPVCFANANASGRVAEPTYDMVVEMLQALRDQRPYPPTAIQFTGGEPTIHPDFHRIVAKANQMGFTHVQIATNGVTHADPEFVRRSAAAGLHTLYLQFDGVGPDIYRVIRRQDLWEKKLACVENCKQTGMKICLVPTIINGVNNDQVGTILRFAVEHVDAISAIAYQPVVFTGRISARERRRQRYTLGDLAHDIADAIPGADIDRDFLPLGSVAPLSRVMQLLDGKPKIRSSCHSDCAFGTYLFVTPEKDAIPIPSLFDFYRLMDCFNELAARIQGKRELASRLDRLRVAWQFIKTYRWRRFDRRIPPFTFMRALQGLTNKRMGRGQGEKKSYKTLMAAGMHFMDRYNFDVERVKRCVIQYSTPDGFYPFCTINGGPTYRPFLEAMTAAHREKSESYHTDVPLRPNLHADTAMPPPDRLGRIDHHGKPWADGQGHDVPGGEVE
ncbi:MAG: radical SAM protein [Phycisphaerales bacterium]|nr:MAG: radical SAM protein [Phycisphaerales bacterium]